MKCLHWRDEGNCRDSKLSACMTLLMKSEMHGLRLVG